LRTILTTASVVALLATGAGSAAARPIDMPTTRIDADAMRGIHADAMRYKAEAAYYLHHRNVAPAGKHQDLRNADQRAPAAPPVVHVTRLADGGFDWADAGIGAGLAAALLLSAAGASAIRRQQPAAR
jgi:hypothetical protein